jgi:cytochrome c oxidase assembly factor CtaG
MKLRLVSALLLLATPALAHGGEPHAGSMWTLDARIVIPLAISVGLYGTGLARLWFRSGIGRGVRRWQAACFAAGWLLLVLALVSPLHWLGERLFAAHMTEHEILMALAAPLLVVARPVGAMVWSLPAAWRPTAGRWFQARWLAVLTAPTAATLLHGAALWLWHAPALYEAALAHAFVHWLQHLSFLVTAVMFWWSLLRGRLRQRGYGAAVFYLFVTALHSGFLGILLAVARKPVYPDQTSAAPAWGFTPLEDQQLAGLIMWVPVGLVYAGAALAFAGLWIGQSGALVRKGGVHAFAR